MNYKEEISKLLNIDGYTSKQIEKMISIISNGERGDYTLPCFVFSKQYKKSPNEISEQFSNNIKENNFIDRVQSINGYLNFYLKKDIVSNEVITEVLNNPNIYKDEMGGNKKICIDYSSVNLAKYMHIGHMSTTMIGESIGRLLENFGYKVFRINYVGDYGTPFGKIVEAYNMWGNEKDIKDRGVDAIQDLYVRFSSESEKNEKLLDSARSVFKDIELKTGENYKTYKWFIDISFKEAKRLLDFFNVQFDSWKGEAAYTDDLKSVVEELENKKLLEDSDGAKIINLEKYGLGTSLIQKTDGTSLYITRDIAAAKSRYNEHKFHKMIYVTAVEQRLHFLQLFKVLDLLGYNYSKSLDHVYYGMFSLTTGKIASRKGRQAVLADLLKLAEDKVEDIIADKNFDNEKKKLVKQTISKAALIYSAIKNDTNKDSILDINSAFNVEGDTSSYILYSYVRICSILRKFNRADAEPDYNSLNNTESFDLIKHMINYKETLLNTLNEYEPSMLCKKIMNIAKDFNKFYSNHKVIVENPSESHAKIKLLMAIKKTFEHGLHILNIPLIEEM